MPGTSLYWEATMTQGNGGGALQGFSSAINPAGSLSNNAFSDGKTVTEFHDTIGGTSLFRVTGFAADPGQNGYFTSVTGHGTTKTAASASSYSYSAGAATWAWVASIFGFNTSGTTACQAA
jgi:hypothetical protein